MTRDGKAALQSLGIPRPEPPFWANGLVWLGPGGGWPGGPRTWAEPEQDGPWSEPVRGNSCVVTGEAQGGGAEGGGCGRDRCSQAQTWQWGLWGCGWVPAPLRSLFPSPQVQGVDFEGLFGNIQTVISFTKQLLGALEASDAVGTDSLPLVPRPAGLGPGVGAPDGSLELGHGGMGQERVLGERCHLWGTLPPLSPSPWRAVGPPVLPARGKPGCCMLGTPSAQAVTALDGSGVELEP